MHVSVLFSWATFISNALSPTERTEQCFWQGARNEDTPTSSRTMLWRPCSTFSSWPVLHRYAVKKRQKVKWFNRFHKAVHVVRQENDIKNNRCSILASVRCGSSIIASTRCLPHFLHILISFGCWRSFMIALATVCRTWNSSMLYAIMLEAFRWC